MRKRVLQPFGRAQRSGEKWTLNVVRQYADTRDISGPAGVIRWNGIAAVGIVPGIRRRRSWRESLRTETRQKTAGHISRSISAGSSAHNGRPGLVIPRDYRSICADSRPFVDDESV